MGGYKNIKPSDNPKPFNSLEGNKNINRDGRPKSIYTLLEETYGKGATLVLFQRLWGIVEVGKDSDAVNAARYLIDQVYGKAKQTIDMNLPETPKYDLTRLTDEEFDIWQKLISKVTITELT